MSEVNQLMQSLMQAQKEFPPIIKNKEAKGAKFSYRYADLEGVVNGVMPTLEKHGLLFYQVGRVKDCRQVLCTVIAHPASGSLIESDFLLPDCPDPQDAGGAITFFRRYALCAALGVVTEDDDDAHRSKPKSPQDGAMPAGKPNLQAVPVKPEEFTEDYGSFAMPFGKYKGTTLAQMGPHGVDTWRRSILSAMEEKGEAPKGQMVQVLAAVDNFLKSRETKKGNQ